MNTDTQALTIARELFSDDEQARSAAMVVKRTLDGCAQEYQELKESNERQAELINKLQETIEDLRPHVGVLSDYMENTGGSFDSDEERRLMAGISMLIQSFPNEKGQSIYRDLVAVYRQERDDYGARLAEYDAEANAIRTLTPENVGKAEDLIDRLFTAGFQTNDEPMLDWARIKMELKRLRIAIIAARRLFESLEEPCVSCGCSAGAAHANDCKLWDWWNEHHDAAVSHRLLNDPVHTPSPRTGEK